jgi:hypothetical protein
VAFNKPQLKVLYPKYVFPLSSFPVSYKFLVDDLQCRWFQLHSYLSARRFQYQGNQENFGDGKGATTSGYCSLNGNGKSPGNCLK